jgi:drug/metabolite transporter (DMT)-like permease
VERPVTPAVTLAVLLGALCHASWNAIVRVRGDKILTITILITAAGILATPGLFIVGVPSAAAWPYLIASIIIHTGYNTFLALAYHHGELSKVYPLVRGSAPLLTLVISVSVLSEAVDLYGVIGIVVLAAGIMTLALDQGWRALLASPRGLLYAAATSLCITAYTLADGLGARAAATAHQYVIWLFVLECLPLLVAVLILKRQAFFAAIGENWKPGVLGGGLSLVSYWIAIWAMTVAPIPIVAALRETSILFAVLIGTLVLREKMTPIRGASVVLVLAGLLLMRL